MMTPTTPSGRPNLVTLLLDGAERVYATTGPGYENTAACKMQATHCAYCARPLTDAESVQRGVGPDCAARYDVASARGPADPVALRAALEAAEAADPVGLTGLVTRIEGELATRGERRASNVLVHLIAMIQTGAPVAHLVTAVAALGYGAQAERIGERLGHVRVTQEGDLLVARLPYDPALIDAIRGIPGRRLEERQDAGKRRKYKVNLIPATQARALWAALKTRLPAGSLVLGVKGYRVIPARVGS